MSTSGAAAQTPVPAEEIITILPKASAFEALDTDFPQDDTFNYKELYADITNNAWYPNLESYVESISKECVKRSTMHIETSKLNNSRHQWITSLLIVIPSTMGVSAILPLPTTFKTIFSGIVSIFLAVLGALNKLMQFDRKGDIHRRAGNKYMKLNSTIQQQILFPLSKRENGIIFAKWSAKIFFTLKEISPFPDDRISKKIGKTEIPSDIPSPTQDISITIPSAPVTPIEGVEPPINDGENPDGTPLVPVVPIVPPGPVYDPDKLLQYQRGRQKKVVFQDNS